MTPDHDYATFHLPNNASIATISGNGSVISQTGSAAGSGKAAQQTVFPTSGGLNDTNQQQVALTPPAQAPTQQLSAAGPKKATGDAQATPPEGTLHHSSVLVTNPIATPAATVAPSNPLASYKVILYAQTTNTNTGANSTLTSISSSTAPIQTPPVSFTEIVPLGRADVTALSSQFNDPMLTRTGLGV